MFRNFVAITAFSSLLVVNAIACFRIWQKFVLPVSIFVHWRNNCCHITLDFTHGGSSSQTKVGVCETEKTIEDVEIFLKCLIVLSLAKRK